MKKSKLDEIKKELETIIEFNQGTGLTENSFFGKYFGYTINLSYDGDYSSIWIGHIDKEFKINMSMFMVECDVEIAGTIAKLKSKESSIQIGEIA